MIIMIDDNATKVGLNENPQNNFEQKITSKKANLKGGFFRKAYPDTENNPHNGQLMATISSKSLKNR